MQVTVTFEELVEKYDWESVCEILGLDPYCLGRAPVDYEIAISKEDAKRIGIL